jgi:uncharacterized protein (DUF433 family)
MHQGGMGHIPFCEVFEAELAPMLERYAAAQAAADRRVDADADAPKGGPATISTRPGRMGGEPCVSGTRITVKAIRALGTIEQAMRFYPELTREQVEGAWVYDGPFPPDDEAIVDGACARLKVGPLLWMGHAGSVADDRGQWVASVVKPTTNGDAWVWSANRPFQSPASGTESTCRDAVMKMRDVLATWADVSAIEVPTE